MGVSSITMAGFLLVNLFSPPPERVLLQKHTQVPSPPKPAPTHGIICAIRASSPGEKSSDEKQLPSGSQLPLGNLRPFTLLVGVVFLGLLRKPWKRSHRLCPLSPGSAWASWAARVWPRCPRQARSAKRAARRRREAFGAKCRKKTSRGEQGFLHFTVLKRVLCSFFARFVDCFMFDGRQETRWSWSLAPC